MQIPPNLGLSYARDFKNLYSEISAEVPELYLLEFFLEDVAAQRKYNLPDMIHPNPEGYKIIVENLFQFLVDNKIV
jgi:acyl-CoA thioesterase I